MKTLTITLDVGQPLSAEQRMTLETVITGTLTAMEAEPGDLVLIQQQDTVQEGD